MKRTRITPAVLVVGSDSISNNNLLYFKCLQQFIKRDFTIILHEQIINGQRWRVRIKICFFGKEKEGFIIVIEKVMI